MVIIGAGLGGLLCGNILSREGMSVCVIEKNHKPGGSLQTFGRKGCIFNTGFNYINSMDEGQVLYRYFKYFGLAGKLNLKKLDPNGFEIITIPGGRYRFVMGRENFLETMSANFPDERKGLKAYMETINNVCASMPLYTLSEDTGISDINKFSNTGAADYIRSVIHDNRLQNALAGNNLLYAGNEYKTPLFTHSIINHSFINSAWQITDGGHQLVNLLVDKIVSNGGTLLTSKKAEKIISHQRIASGVRLSDGTMIPCKLIIADIHPGNVVNMVDPGEFRKSYCTRISGLQNTMGIFTVYIVFKKNSFPYINANHYFYNQDNVWIASDYDLSRWPQNYLLMNHAATNREEFASTCTILTYMDYDELRKWEHTFTGDRGSDYLSFKEEKASVLIDAVEKQFPGFRNHIQAVYTSTPLTWRDYTGSPEGSAYGILKDYNRLLETWVLPRTHIDNLLLTGQNINLHGILGVTIGSVITCGEIVGGGYLIKKIRNESS